jgi:hypothetical protein
MVNQSELRSLAAIKTPISQEVLDKLFCEARTHSAWLPEPAPVELLRNAYELARRCFDSGVRGGGCGCGNQFSSIEKISVSQVSPNAG